jgi:3-phenylpropionate/trans-cinnamate dioxygenase ferredoxin reductase component
LAQLGVRVTLVFPGERLLHRVLPAAASQHLQDKFIAHGITIVAGAKPSALEGSRSVERVHLDNGASVETDLVVLGIGIELNIGLAEGAGLSLTGTGALIVDEYLRTSDEHIYAAGDIAAWPDPTFGRRLRVEHWDVARGQGLRAGRNMAGEEKPYVAIPYFYSDLFDLSFEAWGDLVAWDQTLLRGSMSGGGFAFYYFDQGSMVGVLAAGRPESERKPMQALVKVRPSYRAVGEKLADEAVDLATLVG